MLWMLTALAITASLTAAVVSALNQGNTVSFPDDLRREKVGATERTKAHAYLEDEGLDVRSFASAKSGLQSLVKGDITYFVDNTTAIRYALNNNKSLAANLQSTDARPQAYAIAVQRGSALRDSLVEANIAVILSASWQETLLQYGAAE
jgi:ABC-type amino acid transport substrate-binding protein